MVNVGRKLIKILSKLNGKKQIGQLNLLTVIIAVILLAVLVPALLSVVTPRLTFNSAVSYLENRGYWILAAGDCYPSDFIPCETGTQSLGNDTNRWKDLWLTAPTIYLGNVTISNSGSQIDIDGQLVLHDEGKVWMEVQPDLDYATVQAFGKPTQVVRGVHQGFSLPIYNGDNEELFVAMDVPREWDGITNPIIHIHCYLPSANNGKRFALQIAWDAFSPKANDIVYANTVTTTTNFACESYSPAYTSYVAEFDINYDYSPSNPLTTCDELAIRIRRSAAAINEISGEVVITHIGVQFLRDKLGEVTP